MFMSLNGFILLWLLIGSLTLVWNNTYSAVISFVSLACLVFIGGCNAITVNQSPKDQADKKSWVEQFRLMSITDKIKNTLSVLFAPYGFYMISINAQAVTSSHADTLMDHFVVIMIAFTLTVYLPFVIGLMVKKYLPSIANTVAYI